MDFWTAYTVDGVVYIKNAVESSWTICSVLAGFDKNQSQLQFYLGSFLFFYTYTLHRVENPVCTNTFGVPGQKLLAF